jgi:hypothetical protein
VLPVRECTAYRIGPLSLEHTKATAPEYAREYGAAFADSFLTYATVRRELNRLSLTRARLYTRLAALLRRPSAAMRPGPPTQSRPSSDWTPLDRVCGSLIDLLSKFLEGLGYLPFKICVRQQGVVSQLSK